MTPILQRLYFRLGWSEQIGPREKPRTLAELDREAAQAALEDHKGRKGEAAKALGITVYQLNEYLRPASVLILICAHLCSSVASAQVKGATALLNLVAAPAAPTVSSPLALPAASLAPQSSTADRTKMSLAWIPNGPADTYRVWYGGEAGNYTNTVTTTNTSVTINVTEGVTYYFMVTAMKDGKESPESNMVSATAGFYLDLVDHIKIVRTRGKAGSTNRVQEASSPSGPWATLKTFVGNGAWTDTLVTNNAAKKFFRTVSP